MWVEASPRALLGTQPVRPDVWTDRPTQRVAMRGRPEPGLPPPTLPGDGVFTNAPQEQARPTGTGGPGLPLPLAAPALSPISSGLHGLLHTGPSWQDASLGPRLTSAAEGSGKAAQPAVAWGGRSPCWLTWGTEECGHYCGSSCPPDEIWAGPARFLMQIRPPGFRTPAPPEPALHTSTLLSHSGQQSHGGPRAICTPACPRQSCPTCFPGFGHCPPLASAGVLRAGIHPCSSPMSQRQGVHLRPSQVQRGCPVPKARHKGQDHAPGGEGRTPTLWTVAKGTGTTSSCRAGTGRGQRLGLW